MPPKRTPALMDLTRDASTNVVSGERAEENRFSGGSHAKDRDVVPLKISFNGKDIVCERRGDPSSPLGLVFTHGAGGGIINPATVDFANGFAGVEPVLCFQGTMNLQSRVKTFQAVSEDQDWYLAFGGRSMGARAAVISAQENGKTKALVLVSYPLVGAQKQDTRDQILLDLPETVDVLFVIGTSDSMCSMDQLRTVMNKMNARTWLVEVQGADHGMSLQKKKGIKATRERTGFLSARWLRDRDHEKPYCLVAWDDSKGVVVDGGWQPSPATNRTADTDKSTKKSRKRKR